MDKEFSLVRQFTSKPGKPKYCVTCGKLATQEALFSVGGGVTLIERYCDVCVEKVRK